MAIRTQTVQIQTPVPVPPPAPGPCNVSAVTPFVPLLFLDNIQVIGSTAAGTPPSGTVTPGSSPSNPGHARIIINVNDYASLRGVIQTNPTQMSFDITYNDQTNKVQGFTFSPPGALLVA